MSGGGWSPEEVANNTVDSGKKILEVTNPTHLLAKRIADSNPFGNSGGEFNAPSEGWGPYTPQPYVDPMTLINQKYTKQGTDNSLAPMQAYQQYMQNRR